MITKDQFNQALTYDSYQQYANERFAIGKTTGQADAVNTEFYLHYTKMNLSRTKRIEKTVVLTDEIKAALDQIKSPQNWLIIVESWCGDVPHNLPLIQKMTEYQPLIQLRHLLRDENLEIMDQYLTNGGRSIPKLIAFDERFEKELFTWGPRPAELQVQVDKLKAKGLDYTVIAEETQKWYNKDKGAGLMSEILGLV